VENAVIVETIELPWEEDKTNALAFVPASNRAIYSSIAIFAHGYTSHKGSILNWAARLSEEGIPSLIFDLPGHYLGNFSRVSSFEAFKNEAPHLFSESHQAMLKLIQKHHPSFSSRRVIVGGHSLGALLALKSLDLPCFESVESQAICVGLGLPAKGKVHLFDTPFYKSTLALRAQFVDSSLAPEKVFPWIKEEKEQMKIKNKNIYFLTGKDDLVVGNDGTERLADHLEKLGNNTVIEKPTKLPHHQPEMAAAHIKKFLKTKGYFS
jgi:predicted esterase